MVTLTTSFRTIPNLPLSTWKDEFRARQSPLSQADIEDIYAATQGWAVSLDQAIGESSLRDAGPVQRKNLLNLKDETGFKSYGRHWECFVEYMRRVFDPAYKGGAYYPASLGVGGVVPGYDLSLAGYKVIYQGGPGCLSSRGATCANGERYDPLKPMLGMSVVNDPNAPSINRSIAASMVRYDRWFVPPTTTTTQPPGTTTTSPPGSGTIVFGRVAKPVWKDRQIPDRNTYAWDALGQRLPLGVVYHRQVGLNWGTDSYFRSGAAGLTDWGIDAYTGETLQWNDYLGKGRPGISPHRSPWANGPWENPPGDGRAFVSTYGVSGVNRFLTAFEIDRYYDSPIQKAGFDQIVRLSAYIADQQKIPWETYPLNPHTALVFTYTHNEFQNHKPCPGEVVLSMIPDIIEATKQMLRRAQLGV